ncbi:hypothetical protein EMIT0P265_270004 [Pseudomonas zeae]
MLKMSIKKLFFALVAFNLVLWALFTFASLSAFRGDHTVEGTLMLADGLLKNIKITTSVSDDEVYEVISVEGFYMEFYRKIYSRLWKDYRFYNISEGVDQIKDRLYGDDRLVFNYLYSVRKGTRLTVNNIVDADFGACFYINELKKVRCMNRQDDAHALHISQDR